ncbi:MAG: hypothetical protein WC652_02955 [archaeon]|jgi:hypothetical protein
MNTFNLAIYGIVTIALILLFLNLIPQFLTPESNNKLISTTLEMAQTQTYLGKTINLGALLYPEKYTLQKDDLSKDKPIISFECLTPNDCCIRKQDQNKDYKCTKPVSWDYDFFSTKESHTTNTSVRCIRIDGVGVCKVYFGTLPAQAQVGIIEILDTSTGNAEVKVNVKNVGSGQLAFGQNSIKLFKKSTTDWIETDYYSEPKEVNTIMPQEKYSFLWSISPKNSGEYKAVFKFEGQNAGYDENYVIFTLDKSNLCNTTEQQTTTTFNAENSNYMEIHYCTGCSYSFECANTWSKKENGKEFVPLDKDSAYCTKLTYEGSC